MTNAPCDDSPEAVERFRRALSRVLAEHPLAAEVLASELSAAAERLEGPAHLYQHGDLAFVELIADSAPKSREEMRSLIGAEFEEVGPPPLAFFHADRMAFGIVVERRTLSTQEWIPFFWASDVERAVARAVDEGAVVVVPPTHAPGPAHLTPGRCHLAIIRTPSAVMLGYCNWPPRR